MTHLNIKNILITGGAGFIGSHIVEKLTQEEYQVIVVDNYSNVNSGFKDEKAIYINEDILSDNFEKIFQNYAIDICIHLAANASISIANKNPLYDANQNIIGTIKTLNLCQQYKVKQFIAASSAAVYGVPEYLPIDEKHKTEAISIYGLSKLTMEKYVKLSGVDYLILRFANVYGERQIATGEAGVISIFENAMNKNKDIYINGDGEQTRDFIHVKDIANVIAMAIEKRVINQTINVSTNKYYSINYLYKLMAKLQMYSKEPIYLASREGDIKDSVLDNSKLIEILNYKHFITLDDGLKKLIEYKSKFIEKEVV